MDVETAQIIAQRVLGQKGYSELVKEIVRKAHRDLMGQIQLLEVQNHKLNIANRYTRKVLKHYKAKCEKPT